MIAVAEGLRWCHDSGHFPTYAAAIVTSTFLIRSAIAGPLYTYAEKNQALVSSAYYDSTQTSSNPRNIVRRPDGTIDMRLQRSLVSTR